MWRTLSTPCGLGPALLETNELQRNMYVEGWLPIFKVAIVGAKQDYRLIIYNQEWGVLHDPCGVFLASPEPAPFRVPREGLCRVARH